jgi:hypothetical protein
MCHEHDWGTLAVEPALVGLAVAHVLDHRPINVALRAAMAAASMNSPELARVLGRLVALGVLPPEARA